MAIAFDDVPIGDAAIGTSDHAEPKRPVWRSIARGLLCCCPQCGAGRLFSGYTTVNDCCPACNEALHHHRADDFPPYLTILVVGHIVVPAMLTVERAWHPDLWIHMALWLPLTLALTLGLLRPIKGGVVGLQWALRMHGFDPTAGAEQPIPDATRIKQA